MKQGGRVDLVYRYLEKKRRRLEEIASEVARLSGLLEELRQEDAKVRTQIETAEEMVSELGEEAGPRTPEKSSRPQRRKRLEPRKPPKGGVTLVEAIRQATRELPHPLSTGAVKAYLNEHFPELASQSHHSSIAGTMRRMAVKGVLEAVEKGGPGKEATYRLPSGAATQQPQSMGLETANLFEEERDQVESAR